MNDFWQFIGWALLGVFCAMVALTMVVLGFINMLDGNWGMAIFLFIVAIIFIVGAIAAFKQVP